MSESYVCDLTLVMRARLLLGFYNHRSVPPRWRPLARAYCVTLTVAMSIFFFYFTQYEWVFNFSLYAIPTFFLYYLGILVSLWTGDEYIYKFFRQNELTDVTLDSRMIFNRLQVHVKRIFYFWFTLCLACIILYPSMSYIATVPVNIVIVFIDQIVYLSSTRNLLIMSLFDARLLVLKRRLQRYGFRTVGRAQRQPYCQVYDEILRSLDETDQPLKLLLFFDVICNCCKFIITAATYIFFIPLKDLNSTAMLVNLAACVFTVLEILVLTFGFVAHLESGSAHCEDMAVFTVTQLIKAPTAEERQLMRDFLGPLERRGARYHLLRAMPLDARFLLRALGFCLSQIILIITAMSDAKI